MLNTSLVGSATLFLQNLISQGKVLEPVKGTPLAELSLCCLSAVRDINPASGPRAEELNLESLCFDVVELSNCYNGKIQSSSDHDVYMDRAIVMASDVIQRNLNLTRNKVQPMVRELVEHVEVELQNFSNVTFQTPILTDRIFDAFTHPFILDMVNDAAAKVYYADLPFIKDFPALSAESIRELIPSMNSDLDNRIQEVLDAIGAENLISLYMDAFVNGSISLKKTTRNENIILLIIANNLITTKPTSVGSQVDEFFNVLYTLKQQVALRIKNDLARWREAYEANRLVLAYPERINAGADSSKDPIIVHDDLYTEWLTAGGDPDLIYGAFFSDRPMNGQEILRERGKYQYEATQYLTQLQAANDNKRSAVIRRALRDKMTEIFNTELATEGTALNETHRTAYNLRLNDATSLELDDTLGFSTLLVCESLYPQTYAKKIIDGLNRYQKQYPNSQVEDLATLVISDLLVEWAVNLLTIKELGA